LRHQFFIINFISACDDLCWLYWLGNFVLCKVITWIVSPESSFFGGQHLAIADN